MKRAVGIEVETKPNAQANKAMPTATRMTSLYKEGMAPHIQGSLEEPPIVIRQDQGKLVFFWIFYAVAFSLCLLLVRVGDSPLGNFLAACIFALALLLIPFKILKPDTLVIDPSGVTFRALFTRHYDWDKSTVFEVHRYFGLAQVYGVPSNRLGGAMFRGKLLGYLWETDPWELATLLNEARERWGK